MDLFPKHLNGNERDGWAFTHRMRGDAGPQSRALSQAGQPPGFDPPIRLEFGPQWSIAVLARQEAERLDPEHHDSHAIARASGGERARIYAVHCASCHGAELQGQPVWQSRRPNGRLPAPRQDERAHLASQG
jgi:mono/diheme cytochrome c family protein